MKQFLYKAKSETDHKALGKYLQELESGEFVITVKKNRAIRSLSQNKYLHFAINILAIHTGHTHEEIYDIAKLKFNSKMIELPKAGMQIVPQSTSNLDTKKFAAFMNRFVQWCRDEFNVIIPQPGELDQMKQFEIDNQYERIHSGY